jgi:exopolysaccharide biosynthesis polyprenyl glycosylphosphotransferase
VPASLGPLTARRNRRNPVVLGQSQEIHTQFSQLTDAILLVGALALGYGVRRELGIRVDAVPPIEPVRAFLWWIVLVIPFGPLLLDLQRFYDQPLRKNALKSIKQAGIALLWLAILICGSAFFFRLYLQSRSVLLLFCIFGTAILVIKERSIAAYLRRRSARSEHREKVILAGSFEEICTFRERLKNEQNAEVEIVQTIDISVSPISELVRSLHEYSVGRVIFSAARTELGRVEEAVAACEQEGVEAWLIADFIRTSIARPAFEVFGSQPMLVFRSTPDRSWALESKRAVDIVGALLGLIFCSPIMLGAAIGIKLTSPGPILFSQMRSGRHGKPFRMFKFRSMYTDAEQRKQELEAFNQMSGPVFKLDNDPRVTPIGSWLRKTSIDELPQLWNVLMGQMSLVGPRPLPTYEVENFEDPAQRRRLSVKPGITCLWQISGRNEVRDFATWVKLDLEYVDNWSIWLDLWILLRTVPVVLMAHGAK